MPNHGKEQMWGRLARSLVGGGMVALTLANAGCGMCWFPQALWGGHASNVVAYDSPGAKKPEPPSGQNPGTAHAAEGVVQAGYETPSQTLAFFSQRLAAAEDDRKVLTAQLQQLEGQLEAKNQALATSAQEIEAARAEVTATRTEMERWKEKMAVLQERLKSIEKEDLGTLTSIIKLLEQAVEEGKEMSPAKPAVGQPDRRPTESHEGP